MCALDFVLTPPKEIAVIGDFSPAARNDTRELLDVAERVLVALGISESPSMPILIKQVQRQVQGRAGREGRAAEERTFIAPSESTRALRRWCDCPRHSMGWQRG